MLGNVTKAIYWKKILGNTAAGVDDAEVDGAAIDARGFDSALFILELGAVTTGGKVAFQIQESSNGTDFTDIAGAIRRDRKRTKARAMTPRIEFLYRRDILRYQYQRTTQTSSLTRCRLRCTTLRKSLSRRTRTFGRRS